MKLGLLAASLVLVAGGAVGCGDDGDSGGDGGGKAGKDDESTSAEGTSTEAFCGAFQAFADDLAGMTGEEENLGEILKEAAQRIVDVGTPDDIPDDAKDGLQLTLDAIEGLPDDASAEDMSALEDNFSEEEQKKSDAFSDYLDETCPELNDAPSASSAPSLSVEPTESGEPTESVEPTESGEPSESGDGS